jgi:hypothetical protein
MSKLGPQPYEKGWKMAAVKSWGLHGTIRRYRQGGCNDLRGGKAGEGERCADCKLAQKEHAQGLRAGQAIPTRSSNVHILDKRRLRSNKVPKLVEAVSNTDLDGSESRPRMGRNEKAAYKQLKEYEDREPLRVEMALTAARILDDPDRVALHGTVLRQLDQIVERLTGGRKTKSKGRLAAVQAMTARAR